MTLTIKLDGNWSSFQLANNTPPLSVTGSVIAPSARMPPGDPTQPHQHSTAHTPLFRICAAAGAAAAAVGPAAVAGAAAAGLLRAPSPDHHFKQRGRCIALVVAGCPAPW